MVLCLCSLINGLECLQRVSGGLGLEIALTNLGICLSHWFMNVCYRENLLAALQTILEIFSSLDSGHEASQLSSQLTAELTATSWNLLFAVPFVLRSLSEFSRQFCITTVTMYLAFIIPHCMCALLRPRLRSALTLILLCNCSLSADGRNLSVFAKGYCFSFHCCPE